MNNRARKNAHSLLVINPAGKLRMLYFPVRMICITDFPTLPKGTMVYVDAIWHSDVEKLLYLINGKFYPYWGFSIKIGY